MAAYGLCLAFLATYHTLIAKGKPGDWFEVALHTFKVSGLSFLSVCPLLFAASTHGNSRPDLQHLSEELLWSCVAPRWRRAAAVVLGTESVMSDRRVR